MKIADLKKRQFIHKGRNVYIFFLSGKRTVYVEGFGERAVNTNSLPKAESFAKTAINKASLKYFRERDI